MLASLTQPLASVKLWTEKEQTQPEVKVFILDYLLGTLSATRRTPPRRRNRPRQRSSTTSGTRVASPPPDGAVAAA